MKRKFGTNLASRITDQEVLPGLRVLSMRTSVERVVRIRGSLLGGSYSGNPKNPLVADLAAAMLTESTKKHAKKSLHELLDSRGISISFRAGNSRLHFSASCLREDLSRTIQLISEMLREPAFADEELAQLKKRLLGEVQERATDTSFRAKCALSQALFPPGHPNYFLSTQKELQMITDATRHDLLAYHKKLGLGEMAVVIVGDIESKACEKEIAKQLRTWKKSEYAQEQWGPGAPSARSREQISIPDKTSVHYVTGLAIPLGNKHPDFYPLLMGNAIFGGGFTSRLTEEVRKNQGLTYDIYSSVVGTSGNTAGFWFIIATFAPALLARGEAAVGKELKKIAQKGVTEKELAQRKTAIIGGYKVGLATTGGLASNILWTAEEGYNKEFIDEYPSIFEKITLSQVNAAIKKYIDPKKLVTVVAGTV